MRLAFAPGRHFAQDGEEARLGGARLQALPGIGGVEAVGGGVEEDRHLLLQPMGAAAGIQAFGESLVGWPQMDDIGQRVGDLAIAERARRPVGEAHGFVDARPGQLGRQRLVADGVAEAADHCRDLGVEERAGDPAQHVIENLKILAGGVEDLEQPRIGQQVEERA